MYGTKSPKMKRKQKNEKIHEKKEECRLQLCEMGRIGGGRNYWGSEVCEDIGRVARRLRLEWYKSEQRV